MTIFLSIPFPSRGIVTVGGYDCLSTFLPLVNVFSFSFLEVVCTIASEYGKRKTLEGRKN